MHLPILLSAEILVSFFIIPDCSWRGNKSYFVIEGIIAANQMHP